MANVIVRLPVGLVGVDGVTHLECGGRTVGEALADCIEREPRLRTRIYREDGRVWVGVFLNGRNVRQGQGLETPIRDGDEIRLLPPIAGG